MTVCFFIISRKNVGGNKKRWHWVFDTEGRVVVGAMDDREPHTPEVDRGWLWVGLRVGFGKMHKRTHNIKGG